MKKLGKLLLALAMVVILPLSVNAKGKEPITVHMFRGEGCGYCAAALKFFDSIEEEYGDYFDLETHEVWYDQDNSQLMQDVASYFGEDVGGVPYIIIGDKTFQGYAADYDEKIKSEIKKYYESGDFVDRVAQVKGGDTTTKKDNKKDSNKTTIIIVAVAVVGMVALLFFARDPKVVEKEEIKVVEEEKVEVKDEPKKAPAKKAAPKKTTAAKKAPAKKTTTNKTTTKKTTAKKTTGKKTTKK